MGLLEELAVRCEALDAPDWDLNNEIAALIESIPAGYEHDREGLFRPQNGSVGPLYVCCCYLYSLEAARLVWIQWDHCEVYRPDHQTLGWSVHLYTNANQYRETFSGFAQTEAMAWTAASLRARHALALSKGSEG